MCDLINNIEQNTGAVLRDNLGVMNFPAPVERESQLRKIIDIMLLSDIVDVDSNDLSIYDTKEYDIDGEYGKIQYNNLKDEWLEIIYDYPSFDYIINDALSDDQNGVSQKGKFLMQLKAYYRAAKKELKLPFKCQESIKEKSSEILDTVKKYHMDFLKKNDESNEHYDENYINMLIAFGFIECKILEKPIN